MSFSIVSKNSSVSLISSAFSNQMPVSFRNMVIFALLNVMETPKVMPYLVTKAVISEGAGLPRHRDGVTIGVTEGGGSPTAIKLQSQQRRSVGRVSQLLVGTLHLHEVVEEVGTVFCVVDGGLLHAELGHGDGDLAVDIALVSLSYHLVDEVLYVGCGCSKLRSVIKHY